MCACADRADRQSRLSVEEASKTLNLLIEVTALSGGELFKRFYRDVKPAARAPLVPDPGNDPIDEQHRVVSCLSGRSQRALCGLSRKEHFPWLAADDIGVEVGK